MKIDTTHPQYDEFEGKWARARDVMAGEDQVKAAREKYLPRLGCQTDAEYGQYLLRSSFFNATARTAEGFSGLVFRRDPIIRLPKNNSRLGQALEAFRHDADLLGSNLAQYAKNVVDDVLVTGRGGTVIDWQDLEQRAYFSFYRAEDILNWRMERVNGRPALTLVTLREVLLRPSPEFAAGEQRIEQIRILELKPVPPEDRSELAGPSAPIPTGAGAGSQGGRRERCRCEIQLWQKRTSAETGEPVWSLAAEIVPHRRGQPLESIPFVFHGPQHSLPWVSKLPMDDIIALNLDHYRLNADYKHGIHFTALPTAWVAGFDIESRLHVGSSTAWVSDSPDASAGFLEFKGDGLQTFERAMDRDERLMAILGSRLLQSQKRVAETAEALTLRQTGESSVLGNLAKSISRSLTLGLHWAYWWHSAEDTLEEITEAHALIDLNTDYESSTMTSQELAALVQAWQAGAISRDSMFNLLRQGELLPPGRSNDEEQSLLQGEMRGRASVISHQ